MCFGIILHTFKIYIPEKSTIFFTLTCIWLIFMVNIGTDVNLPFVPLSVWVVMNKDAVGKTNTVGIHP